MWKIIEKYSQYQIHSSGKVKSIDRYIKNRRGLVKGKVLTPRLNNNGYFEIYLNINRKQIIKNPHRLVAKAFIPNFNNYKQVNHINGIKTDNRVENLEWVNNSMNQLHAYKLGLQTSKKGEGNGRSKLTFNDVSLIKTKYNNNQKIVDISKELNIPISRIHAILYRKSWKSHTMKILKKDERK